MLRRHAVTLEFIEHDNTYRLDIDGYTIYLTSKNIEDLIPALEKGGSEGALEIANFLKDQDPALYDTKLTPIADNPNAYDVLEVLQCQLSKPVFTQRPSK